MNKTIVSIISEQTIPNYLFIKEFYQIGDELMFISSQKVQNRIEWIKDVLEFGPCNKIDVIFGKKDDEENWSEIISQVKAKLSKEKKYAVNLTGGTKFLALAIQKVFSEYNADFYYIPYPKNVVLLADEQCQRVIPINHRVTVDEYTRLYNTHLHNQHQPCFDKEFTFSFFNRFVSLGAKSESLSQDDYAVVDRLRSYRNDKCLIVSEVEKIAKDEKHPVIEGLSAFLSKISFPNKTDRLSKDEIQYLTGGWFEEYVYHLVKEKLNPTDIVLGPKTKATNNDLDVVFTLGNKLFVIECKTGVEGGKMLNEIVYKASALKENLLGLSARSFIFSLGQEKEEWTKAAKNMGIEYLGISCFTDLEKFDAFASALVKQAFD